MITTNETYPWSFVTHIFRNCKSSHGSDRNSRKIKKNEDFKLITRTKSFIFDGEVWSCQNELIECP